MWNYVGIVRREPRLKLAKMRIKDLKSEVDTLVENYKISPNMLELRNILVVALLIIEAAQERKKSQGLHYILEE